MKRRKWRAGDVIQVRLPTGYRYLHFVGKDSNRIDVLRVLDVATERPLSDVSKLGAERTAYWIQSMCSVLVDDSRFTFLGNSSGAGEIPPLRRCFFGGWIIVNSSAQTFVSSPISDEIARMSLEEGVPAQVLIDRLSSDWRPQDARDDIVQELRDNRDRAEVPGGVEVERETVFFMDFPSAGAATEARKKLIERGFTAEPEHDRGSLAVRRRWKKGASLDSMDLLELDLLAFTKEFEGRIRGRETSV